MTRRIPKLRRPKFSWIVLRFSLIVFITLGVNFVIFGAVVAFLAETGRLGTMDSVGRTLPVLFAAVASLSIGAVLAIGMVRVQMRWIPQLLRGMKRLSEGHYDERVDLGRAPFQRRVAQGFNALAQELQSTEMLRSDFVNNFSHEFKTPIVSISGFARLLERGGVPPEEEREYLKIIASESTRLANMATNVLNLTKIENQNILTNVTEFNVSEQLRRCILLLEKRWTAKGIEIEADFGEHMVRGSEELLQHVWVNLLDNAVKFSPEGGTLHAAIREDARWLRVEIGNEGPPIDPETRRHMFEKFYQGETSHAREGAGIGLSVVKKVVSLHGGEIEVDSAPGRTTFAVRLPRGGQAGKDRKSA